MRWQIGIPGVWNLGRGLGAQRVVNRSSENAKGVKLTRDLVGVALAPHVIPNPFCAGSLVRGNRLPGGGSTEAAEVRTTDKGSRFLNGGMDSNRDSESNLSNRVLGEAVRSE